ncbi:MAG: T9SS type A sorting domain-containing protein [Bacteroidetes bacterium]|nr:T9SS type A sorting domain-containing protein [Bacteroidota bacterium]
MKKLNTTSFALFFLISFTFMYSRPWRPDQIPNGQKFSCSNCHINPQGGGPRNKFGQAVEQLVAPGSTQEFWSQTLAQMDSDGDGVTNGHELGDPNGTWKAGQPNPGDFNLVTNPGDPNSVPTEVADNNSLMPAAYRLYNNYPNPFNPSTNISFEIPQSGNVSLTIFNSLGQVVKTLVSDELSPGRHNFVWDGTDDANNNVASGIYLYKLTAGTFTRTMRMVLLK